MKQAQRRGVVDSLKLCLALMQFVLFGTQGVGLPFQHQVGPYPCAHDALMEWFDDEVNPTFIKPTGFLQRIVLPGDKNNRDIPCQLICLEAAADFVAAHFRHDHVEQDQIRTVALTE